MIALVTTAAIGSSLGLYLFFGLLLLGGIAFAPQPVKRDKRVIAAVIAIALFIVIGHAIEAGPWHCPYQGTIFEFLCYVP